MNRQKKRLLTLLVPLTVFLVASWLMGQSTPNSCADACLQAYRNAVIACHGDATCLANARATLQDCIIHGCHLTPPR
jgi:hypothetical protein